MTEQAGKAANAKNIIRSAERVLSLLSVFTPQEPELTPPQIGKRLGLDRGTVFRLLHTLVEAGYVCPSFDNKRYRLTLKCLEIGYNALNGMDLRTHALPIIRELVPEFGDAASYGVLDRDDVVYVARCEKGAKFSDINRRPGNRFKAYAAALGQVILAYMPREEQVERLNMSPRTRLSEYTLVDLDDLLERLDLVQTQGYAASDRENAYGFRTVAAPVLFPDGSPVGGVSLTITADRMEMEPFVEQARPVVQRVANLFTDAVRFSSGRIADGPYANPETVHID